MNSAPTITNRASPKPRRSATTMPGSAAGSTAPRSRSARGGAQARRRPQQHDVDAQHAGRDGDEHRKERRVGDEGDLRRLAEAEPDQEHRQEGQRRDRPHELDRSGSSMSRSGTHMPTSRPKPSAASAASTEAWATRPSDVARDASQARRRASRAPPRHLRRRGQQHRVDELEPRVAVGDHGPERARTRPARARAHSCTLATSSFTTRVMSLSYWVNSGGEAVTDLRQLDRRTPA